MGQTFSGDNGDRNKLIAKTALDATAGGLNAASGAPQQPVDFSAIGKTAKKLRGGPVSLSDGRPNVIPRQGPDANVPDFNVPQPNPMPDLYGQNGQIPQLKKGILPFYGQ